ncbi:MAG: hypothetical protein B7X04_03960 [Parcubacteria group bacterium 21-54-25]|nr:MAG: hypothetical protein B7X04_03960 [Parcubacteria group bacterium 21-54-25]HQU08149.1 hypothetical protein [Candidatus Paceibacterota bacterium]
MRSLQMQRQKKEEGKLITSVALCILGSIYAWKTLLIVWPLVVIYLMFAWKEYVSGQLLFKMTFSRWPLREVLTVTEIVLYFALAASFAHPEYFSILMLGALLFEALIYMLGLTITEESTSIYRKVKMNIVEALLALAAFIGMFFSYTQIVLVLWGIIVTDITIYAILFRKVYAARVVPNLAQMQCSILP